MSDNEVVEPPLSAGAVLRRTQDWLEEYPEVLDVPVKVEFQSGGAPLLHVVDVDLANGTLYFVVEDVHDLLPDVWEAGHQGFLEGKRYYRIPYLLMGAAAGAVLFWLLTILLESASS
jgi:hypothetical protein